MNIVLLRESDFEAPGYVLLTDRRAAHILGTIRARVGDELFCGMINGNTGKGLITGVTGESVQLAVHLDSPPPAPLPMNLILAVPRPKMLRRILESATSLGIKSLYLINSWRVEKSFWQSPVLSEESIAKALVSGLEQAGDTMMPEIHQRRFFTGFVKNELPEIASDTRRFVAHPKTSNRFPSNVQEPVTCAVGPEGGFIDLEIETLEEQGFQTAALGKRILRVETTIPFIASRLFSGLF
ncbi:MAG: 16S rRNA (uracil(1498)-N(3))-methyltransferase [Desulfarculaceae bacterium]|nr:16S rRNA (uracil(1498)-N(3))-methyltransferase [Desulfarculaceae bacterium]